MPVGRDQEPLRFLHIIKTGGESIEHHLVSQPMPKLDFSTYRSTATSTVWTSNMPTTLSSCLEAAFVVSSALCGLNYECCGDDIRLPSRGFHGTIMRSPRAHALSLFSHGHVAQRTH